jgi:hypothetical protein
MIYQVIMNLNEIKNDVPSIYSSVSYLSLFRNIFYRSIAANNIYDRGNINKNPTA